MERYKMQTETTQTNPKGTKERIMEFRSEEKEQDFLDDVLDLVIQATNSTTGKSNLSMSDLCNGLRGSIGAFVTPRSGRRWRNLPIPYELLSYLEDEGFEIVRKKGKRGQTIARYLTI
jgi:hypothetical protein